MKPIIVNADDRHPLQSMRSILTERQLTVLHLRIQQGMTQAEVAVVIGVSQPRVKQIESAALGTLRRTKNLVLDL